MPHKVREIMMPNPQCLREEQSIFSAREMFLLGGKECVFVIDKDRKPVGVVTTLHASVEDSKKKVTKVMTSDFELLHEEQTIPEAAAAFARHDAQQYTALPVVDAQGGIVGIVQLADLVKDLSTQGAPAQALTPEASVVQLSMTKDEESERGWMTRIQELGYRSAVTQVGTSAEKLPVKMRESAIVAAIAHGVITEDTKEKVAVSNAVRDLVLQMDVVSPGLGGGYKIGVVRGEGRVAVAACGRCGHALASSPEQIFLGVSIV